MEKFCVHILGCGSALPTLRHNATSQVVEIRGKCFMIDCGEGTQTALRRSHVAFGRIQAVFISHLHGDHCFGLIGMISTFGMLGRTAPLHIYAPKELEAVLNLQLKLFGQGLEFKVVFHVVDTTQSKTIYEDKTLLVDTIPLDHRMPCCGFLFKEKPGLPHIRRDMIEYYHIPVSQINNIKHGASWITEEGEIIENNLLTTAPTPPRSYAYCSDTRYMPHLHEKVRHVNLLYHESTYTEEYSDKATLYAHSTARQAAKVARDAEVGKLLLGHYSARYTDETQFLKEAQSVFESVYLAQEGMVMDV